MTGLALLSPEPCFGTESSLWLSSVVEAFCTAMFDYFWGLVNNVRRYQTKDVKLEIFILIKAQETKY
jgi:hypothetical protein